jgi:hypothetical protein
LLDGEALRPGAAPADPCPVVTEPDGSDVDPFDDAVAPDVVMSDEPSSQPAPAESEPPQDASAPPAVPVVVPPNVGVKVGVIVLGDVVIAELLMPVAVFCEAP